MNGCVAVRPDQDLGYLFLQSLGCSLIGAHKLELEAIGGRGRVYGCGHGRSLGFGEEARSDLVTCSYPAGFGPSPPIKSRGGR